MNVSVETDERGRLRIYLLTVRKGAGMRFLFTRLHYAERTVEVSGLNQCQYKIQAITLLDDFDDFRAFT